MSSLNNTQENTTTIMSTIQNRSSLENIVKKLSVLAIVAVSALTGCADEYDRTEISAVVVPKVSDTNDPSKVINTESIKLYEGTLVKAHIVVWNDDNVQMPLTVVSDNLSVIEVTPVVSDRDYAFVAKGKGTTTVKFLADGKPVVTLTATVEEQKPIE